MSSVASENFKEFDIQCAYKQWFDIQYPLCLMWHTPNGGYRRKFEGLRLKRSGVVAGVPDIFVAEPKGEKSGLFIELKTKKGKPTKSQQSMLDALNNRGYKAVVCHSIDEAIIETKKYLDF